MKVEELIAMYPNLNQRMLNFFLNYALQGTKVANLSLVQLEQAIKGINPNVIFNLPGVISQPQSPSKAEDLQVKLFAVREQIILTALVTTYFIKLHDKYKADDAKIKRDFEDNVVKVLLDKAEKALEPERPRIITDFRKL
jgi:hypothetical protein